MALDLHDGGQAVKAAPPGVGTQVRRGKARIGTGCDSRDRRWHFDRAIIFEFRPVNTAEAYVFDAAYWSSVRVESRAQLADELRARLARPWPLSLDRKPEANSGHRGIRHGLPGPGG
jgi:hypothetical protein